MAVVKTPKPPPEKVPGPLRKTHKRAGDQMQQIAERAAAVALDFRAQIPFLDEAAADHLDEIEQLLHRAAAKILDTSVLIRIGRIGVRPELLDADTGKGTRPVLDVIEARAGADRAVDETPKSPSNLVHAPEAKTPGKNGAVEHSDAGGEKVSQAQAARSATAVVAGEPAPAWHSVPVASLKLSAELQRKLVSAGITTARQALTMAEAGPECPDGFDPGERERARKAVEDLVAEYEGRSGTRKTRDERRRAIGRHTASEPAPAINGKPGADAADFRRHTSVQNVKGINRAVLEMQDDFAYVGGPVKGWASSPFANPFSAYEPGHGHVTPAERVEAYERWLLTGESPERGKEKALKRRRDEILRLLPTLKGKRLGCFCCDWWPSRGEPEAPCHAVVLAKLADGTITVQPAPAPSSAQPKGKLNAAGRPVVGFYANRAESDPTRDPGDQPAGDDVAPPTKGPWRLRTIESIGLNDAQQAVCYNLGIRNAGDLDDFLEGRREFTLHGESGVNVRGKFGKGLLAEWGAEYRAVLREKLDAIRPKEPADAALASERVTDTTGEKHVAEHDAAEPAREELPPFEGYVPGELHRVLRAVILKGVEDRPRGKEQWEEIQEPFGATDSYLLGILPFGTGQRVAGVHDGVHYTYRGGKTPAFWFGWHCSYDSGKPEPKPLTRERLVKAIRVAMRVPEPPTQPKNARDRARKPRNDVERASERITDATGEWDRCAKCYGDHQAEAPRGRGWECHLPRRESLLLTRLRENRAVWDRTPVEAVGLPEPLPEWLKKAGFGVVSEVARAFTCYAKVEGFDDFDAETVVNALLRLEEEPPPLDEPPAPRKARPRKRNAQARA